MITFIAQHFATIASLITLAIGIGLIIIGIKQDKETIEQPKPKTIENIPPEEKIIEDIEITPEQTPDASDISPPSSSYSFAQLHSTKNEITPSQITEKEHSEQHAGIEEVEEEEADFEDTEEPELEYDDTEAELTEDSETAHEIEEPTEQEEWETEEEPVEQETTDELETESEEEDDDDYDDEDDDDDLEEHETEDTEASEPSEQPETENETEELEPAEEGEEAEFEEHEEAETSRDEHFVAHELEHETFENHPESESKEEKRHELEGLTEHFSEFEHATPIYRAPITVAQNAQENRARFERVINASKNLGSVIDTRDEGNHLVIELKNGSRLFIYPHEISANEINVTTRAISALLLKEMHWSEQPSPPEMNDQNRDEPEEQP